MEYLHNGFTLNIPDGVFPLSTDSMILADFVKLPRSAEVLDLGSGCASLGLMLCANNPHCRVTGMELDPTAHTAALDNIEANDLKSRLFSICADLREIRSHIAAGSFSCCISNPPYFSGGPASLETPTARRTDFCTAEELFQAAAWALRYGGDFFLVHRPEKLAELCACGAKYNLEPKRLQLLRHQEGGPVSLILLACRKGGEDGLAAQTVGASDRHGVECGICQPIGIGAIGEADAECLCSGGACVGIGLCASDDLKIRGCGGLFVKGADVIVAKAVKQDLHRKPQSSMGWSASHLPLSLPRISAFMTKTG